MECCGVKSKVGSRKMIIRYCRWIILRARCIPWGEDKMKFLCVYVWFMTGCSLPLNVYLNDSTLQRISSFPLPWDLFTELLFATISNLLINSISFPHRDWILDIIDRRMPAKSHLNEYQVFQSSIIYLPYPQS